MFDGKKYFILNAQTGNPIPRVMNWFGKLDVDKLNRKDYRKLPEFLMLELKTGMDVLYPDLLTDPVLMVSKEVMEVLKLYDEEMPFIFAALFDREKEESAAYYCPVLSEGEEGCRDALYRVKGLYGYEIRIRLDLAESLLARGAVGMSLTEISEKGQPVKGICGF